MEQARQHCDDLHVASRERAFIAGRHLAITELQVELKAEFDRAQRQAAAEEREARP